MPIYMNIQGIDGDSTNSQFPNWFEVMSFSWGESNAGTQSSGGGGGAGKVQFSDFSVTKRAGKGSPLIMVACASGKHLPAVQFAITTGRGRDQQNVFEQFKLTEVLVSSYQIGDDLGSNPSETLTLNFAKIEFDQTVNMADGSVTVQTGVWDTRTNSSG